MLEKEWAHPRTLVSSQLLTPGPQFPSVYGTDSLNDLGLQTSGGGSWLPKSKIRVQSEDFEGREKGQKAPQKKTEPPFGS